jgi:sigma-B regulation protein RsbU (phosphoserine phosphatase)
MKILVAEDEPISRRALEATLQRWGYEVVLAGDGAVAWDVLNRPDAPPLAILDWMMPGMDGIEVVRRLRQLARRQPTYVILLTCRSGREDVVTGLEAGADDYVTKPFDQKELQARVRAGARIVELQAAVTARLSELEYALANVRRLQGLLPICSYCKKIRDDQNYWQQVEGYISEHSEAEFSHSVCPDCFREHVQPELDKIKTAPPATRQP